MKKLIIVSAFLISWTALAVPHMPQNWVSSEDTESNLVFKADNRRLLEFTEYVDEVFDAQERVLNGLESNQKVFRGWKFSGMKTDLSVSKSGLFGFSAVKGKSTLELNWVKSGDKSLEDSVAPNHIEIDGNATLKEIEIQLLPLVDLAVESGKVKNKERMRTKLLERAREVHLALKGIDQEMGSTWTPSKFRLNLSFGVSGDIFSVAELGGDFRVRLDFKIAPKAQMDLNKGLDRRLKKMKKLVSNLSEDVSKVAEKVERESGFKLDSISIGLGADKKTFLGIADSKASASGFLFFKKSGKKADLSKTNLDGEYEFASNNVEGEKFLGRIFKRSRFRKGLEKAFNIGNYFGKRAEKKDGKWTINKFKIAFSLSYKGIFSLTNTTGSGVAELYFKK